jgi:WD40 repeat protein
MANSEPLHLTQSSTLPPAQPVYVLRGHSTQIHAVHFFRENLRLVSGDADGWVVLWNIPMRRPVAVWRAHTSTILGVESWGDDKIITYDL